MAAGTRAQGGEEGSEAQGKELNVGGPESLLLQIVSRLDRLQTAIDGLSHCAHASCRRRSLPGGNFQLDQDDLMEAETCYFSQLGAKEPGRLSPCGSEEQQATLSLQNAPDSTGEMLEDILNPMPRGYLAPFPSLSVSGSGSPLSKRHTGERSPNAQLLGELLPQLEALHKASVGSSAGVPPAQPVAKAGLAPCHRSPCQRRAASCPPVNMAWSGQDGRPLPVRPAPPPPPAPPALPGQTQRRSPSDCQPPARCAPLSRPEVQPATGPMVARSRVQARRFVRHGAGARVGGLLLQAVRELLQGCGEEAKVWPHHLLPPLAPVSRAWAVVAGCQRLEHQDEAVRRGAVYALTRLSEPGSELARALAAAGAQLAHAHPGVRLSALQAYTRLVGRGPSHFASEQAVRLICQRVEDDDVAVRNQAVASLGRVVERGDTVGDYAVTELLSYLSSADPNVRCSALQAISEVAEKGDTCVIQGVVPVACKDSCPRARELADLVLAQLVQVGNMVATAAAVACISEDDPAATCAALSVISCWAGKANDLANVPGSDQTNVVHQVALCLQHRDERVRFLTKRVLREICERGNDYVLTSLMHHLENPDANVRLAALQALGDLAFPGDDCVICDAERLLADESPEVRQAAASVLCLLRAPAERGRGAAEAGR